MGDEIQRRTPQDQAAEAIAAGLEATAGELARTQPRQRCTAPTQEQVVVIKLLAKLAERLPRFCHRAAMAEADLGEWNEIANTLRAASRAVDHEVQQQRRIVVDAEE